MNCTDNVVGSDQVLVTVAEAEDGEMVTQGTMVTQVTLTTRVKLDPGVTLRPLLVLEPSSSRQLTLPIEVMVEVIEEDEVEVEVGVTMMCSNPITSNRSGIPTGVKHRPYVFSVAARITMYVRVRITT